MSGPHDERTSCCGVILTGGRSVRMGSDKALLTWRGQSFTRTLADLLRQRCADVVCVGGPSREPDLVTLPDALDDRGPLAGIASALTSGRAERYLLVTCDAPALSLEDLDALLEAGPPASFADDRRWPLPCVLSADAGPVALDRLHAGQGSLMGFLDAIDATTLAMGDRRPRIQGVNTPEELAALLAQSTTVG